MSNRYWTPREVAELFNIHPDTVRSYLNEGTWPGEKLGRGRGFWRMTQDQVDQVRFGTVRAAEDPNEINRLLAKLP